VLFVTALGVYLAIDKAPLSPSSPTAHSPSPISPPASFCYVDEHRGFHHLRGDEVSWTVAGAGILRGATSCFFGFVGYDEVCCMAAETIRPNRDMPRAVFGTVLIVTFLYCLSSMALVSMVKDCRDIDPESAFASAFRLEYIY
jgi:amino acid transporter